MGGGICSLNRWCWINWFDCMTQFQVVVITPCFCQISTTNSPGSSTTKGGILWRGRRTAYVWVETTLNGFSGLFGGGRGCLLRIGGRHMCRLKPPQDTVSCSFEWLWSLGENALKGWGHLLWIGGRHMCRLKPPWWDHFFTSEPEKYKTKTPTSFEGWGFYIGLLQLSYCFSSSWLLHLFTF